MSTYFNALFGLEAKVALLIEAGAHLVRMKTHRVDVGASQQAVGKESWRVLHRK